MSKAGIWLLIGLGLILLIIGLIFDKVPIWVIGLLLIAGSLYLSLRPGGILRKDEVVDTWGILLGEGRDKADNIFKNTESFINESKAPSIKMEKKAIAPGLIRGILGTKRDFLIVTDQENYRLKPYQIFINARNYGNNLDIAWYLTYKPSIWQSLPALLPYVNVVPKSLSDLDLFDQQDLRAYATNAHNCLLKSTEKLMLELNQDPSKIERKSRGFLGIS